jgi:dCMP deaminase
MDLIYLRMANIWGENSHCIRMKVGCLVVNQKSIISDGYNGSPSGFPNQCESEDNITLPHILHAEANAITKIAKSTQSSYGSTLYVTLSPCFECSKLIIQSGIKRVVFNKLYRNTDSIPFLVQGGVEILKIEHME